MENIFTETKIKVPFYDLDPMNIVWHGNYVKYMEEARCDLFKKLNYDYMNMQKDGFIYPVAKMDMKFIKSAKFGDKLSIKCILKEIEPAVIIKYEIFSGGEKIFTANTMQICVNIKTGETLYEAPDGLKRAATDWSY